MLFNTEKKAPHDADQQIQDANRYLETLSPLVNTIYSNSAVHMIGQGMGIISEFIIYVLALACFLFLFIMNKVFPFYILGEIIDKKIYRDALQSKGDIDAFHIGVKALVVIIGLLLIFWAMALGSARRHRTMLQQSGKELKNLETYFVDKKSLLEKIVSQHTSSTTTEVKPPIDTKTGT